MNDHAETSPPAASTESPAPPPARSARRLVVAGVLLLAGIGGVYGLQQRLRLAAFRDGYLEACRRLRVEVRGRQYKWEFRYPGPDERFGTEDDFVSWDLVLPEGDLVSFQLRSRDVPHRLALHRLGIAQDAPPTEARAAWARVPAPAGWDRAEVRCVRAERCWPGMRNQLRVLPPRDFEAWLQEQYRQDQEDLGNLGETDEGDDEDGAFTYLNWGWPWEDLGAPQHAHEVFPPGEAPPLPDPLPPPGS